MPERGPSDLHAPREGGFSNTTRCPAGGMSSSPHRLTAGAKAGVRASAEKRSLEKPKDPLHRLFLDTHSKLKGKACSGPEGWCSQRLCTSMKNSQKVDFKAKHRRQVSQCPSPFGYYIPLSRLPTSWAVLECSEIHVHYFKSHPEVVYVQNLKINTSNGGHLVTDESQHRGPALK